MARAQAANWGRFEEADRSPNYRMLWSSQGFAGSGKTHFGLTAPDPIAVQLFDPIGLEGLVRQPQFRNKDIRVRQYRYNPGSIEKLERPDVAEEILQEFLEDFRAALKVSRTILWDKEDAVWQLLRNARYKEGSKASSYEELNLLYASLFQEAADAGVNFGVIRGMKEVWGVTGVSPNTGKPQYGYTGEFDARGMGQVPEFVQVTLEHRHDPEDGFLVKVLDKCRLNEQLIGQEIGGMDFITLATLLYPETASTPEVWQ